MEELEKMFREN